MDSELRKRFNPDGSLLRRQQLRMLELLEVIDVICRKHQIPYWLSSGTKRMPQSGKINGSAYGQNERSY